MEMWFNKEIDNLTVEQKDEIIKIVFRSITNNDVMEDIGGDIFTELNDKGYVFKEDIGDDDDDDDE